MINKTEERIHFNVNDLERMIGCEFYLAVTSSEYRQEISGELEKEGASKEVIAEVRDIAGIIGIIESREQHKCVFYELEYLSKITFENGVSVGDAIPRKGTFRSYVFTLQQIGSENQVVLLGCARIYKLCDNILGETDQTMKLYFPKEPRWYKIKSGMR